MKKRLAPDFIVKEKLYEQIFTDTVDTVENEKEASSETSEGIDRHRRDNTHNLMRTPHHPISEKHLFTRKKRSSPDPG